MDLFSLDDAENKLRAQLVKERNRRYQAEEKLSELINVLQKSGLKVPKKFKLEYDEEKSTQVKGSKEHFDDHLAALAEVEDSTEGDNSDFDEENFEMWIEESDVKIKQALEETKRKRENKLNREEDREYREGARDGKTHKEVERLEIEVKRSQEEQMKAEETVSQKTKELQSCVLKNQAQQGEIEVLTKKLEKVNLKLEERTKSLRSLITMNKELASLNTLCMRLEQENRNLYVNLELKQAEIDNFSNIHCNIDKNLSEKDQDISDLRQTIKLKDETIEKMATASFKLKQKLARFEDELCRFTVEKVFKGFPSSTAQLSIVQEIVTKKAHLNLIVNGKRSRWPTDEILTISSSKTEDTKLYIVFRDKSQEAFLSNVTRRDEVLSTLQEVLKNLRDNKS
eukprot:TRINITY_DN1646_c0_g1_i1.p1 TRINITY_DN1646_c0_g1~~TRINITY_DN1646_c0_g1_i1.p1  ORF type:complete len:424 (-),score=94.01 TRINITY_DN1646_c0_g1_i1:51-1244(-)